MAGYAAAHAIIVDWYGPFDTPDAAVAWVRQHPDFVPGVNSVPSHKKDGEPRKPTGIYFAIGSLSLAKLQQPWKRLIQSGRLQYVGIGNVVNRLKKKKHPIRSFMGRCEQVWVGALASFPSPDDAPNVGHRIHDNQLEMAESLLAYFLEAPLNQRKREHAAPEAGVLINRWFRVSNEKFVPFASSPHRSIPDIILWPYDGPRSDVTVLARDRVVHVPAILPGGLERSMAKAALIRFETRAGAISVQTTTTIVQATTARQFDGRLLRKPQRRQNTKRTRFISQSQKATVPSS